MYLRGLTYEQRKRISDAVDRHVCYFERLTNQMHFRRFPPWDLLRITAEDALRSLRKMRDAMVDAGRRE